MFCSENKGGNDVEGKIFADMLTCVWNDARPLELEHNWRHLQSCAMCHFTCTKCAITTYCDERNVAMCSNETCNGAIYVFGKLLDWQTGA